MTPRAPSKTSTTVAFGSVNPYFTLRIPVAHRTPARTRTRIFVIIFRARVCECKCARRRTLVTARDGGRPQQTFTPGSERAAAVATTTATSTTIRVSVVLFLPDPPRGGSPHDTELIRIRHRAPPPHQYTIGRRAAQQSLASRTVKTSVARYNADFSDSQL